jgi:glycosyltransferase involved in cell wall biosynthesis
MPIRVSVLLPVGPDAPFLAETLESLKQQTYSEWELIVVLDGNAQVNRKIVEAATLEVPVTVVEHTTSQGIARSLNAALHRASGDLIARIDADDLMYPQRFLEQVAAFDQDEELMLLGTSATVIDESGQAVGTRIVPTGDAALKRRLISRNSFIHPSVMFRKNAAILIGGYNIHCTRTEDYELWLRLALCGKVDNLPQQLVRYRVHSGQHTTGRNGISMTESQVLLNVKLQLAKEIGFPIYLVRLIHKAWEWNRKPHFVTTKRKAH